MNSISRVTTGHVFLVEDDRGIVTALERALAAEGHTVSVAFDGNAALAGMAVEEPDIVLLDLGLPDMDGKEVIRAIRQSRQTPIIALSARHQEQEKIATLDMGADDYIDKPFVLGELQARIRAALRRSQHRGGAPTGFSGGGLEIDYATRKVRLNGEPVKLSPKEYNLLKTLAERPGQVVTQRRLLAAGWGRSEADPQYLRVYMSLLRNRLEVNASAPELIVTEPGVGYRLAVDAPAPVAA